MFGESNKDKNKFDRKVALITGLLAFVLWAWVTLTNVYTFVVPLPITPAELPENMVLQERLPDTAYVRMKGSGKSFMKLYYSSPVFRLNLSGLKKSSSLELRRRIDEVDFPSGTDLQLLEIVKPQYINIKFSPKRVKKLPVKAEIRFSVVPGYIWVDTYVSPDSVTISGAREVIDDYMEVKTQLVEYIQPLSHGVERIITLDIPVNRNISVKPRKVKIYLDIQRLAENVIHDVPIKIINTPANVTAVSLPPTLTVTLKGGDKILAGVKKEDISAFINYETDYRRDLKRYTVNINAKENVDVVSYEPRYFDLLIKER
jgi:YbbR domain-containing protein